MHFQNNGRGIWGMRTVCGYVSCDVPLRHGKVEG